MKEHPIIFSGPMVKAILEGRKTQTRRVVAPHNSEIGEGGKWENFCWDRTAIYNDRITHQLNRAPAPYVDTGFPDPEGFHNYQYLHVPYKWAEDCTIYRIYCRYEPGDRLWVREKHIFVTDPFATTPFVRYGDGQQQRLDHLPEGTSVWNVCGDESHWKWRPSIHMHRWASRITLEITSVRVERLQQITSHDAISEGAESNTMPQRDADPYCKIDAYIRGFGQLWDSLHPKKDRWADSPWVWCISFRKVQP